MLTKINCALMRPIEKCLNFHARRSNVRGLFASNSVILDATSGLVYNPFSDANIFCWRESNGNRFVWVWKGNSMQPRQLRSVIFLLLGMNAFLLSPSASAQQVY